MANAEQKLKEIHDFLDELAKDKRLAGMKNTMGWPIQRKASGYARDVKDAIDDLRRYKRQAKKAED